MSIGARRYQQYVAKQTDTLNRSQYTIAENLAKQQIRATTPQGGYNWYQLAKKTEEVAKELFKQPQQAAPAPAPAPDPEDPAETQNLQIAKLTEQSEAYRKQAEQSIAEGQSRIAELENEELQRQKTTELQNRLAIQAAFSQARGATQANLKIGAASDTSRTAGTSAFKRRRDQMRLSPIQSTAGVNVPASSVLNV